MGLANARWKPWFLRSNLKAVLKQTTVKQSRNLFARVVSSFYVNQIMNNCF
jgi:hypothetical protein